MKFTISATYRQLRALSSFVLLGLLLLFLFSLQDIDDHAVAAQSNDTIYLVKDINPFATETLPHSSSIGAPAIMHDILYFSASNGQQTGQLWRSDGTGDGTYLVKETSPEDEVPGIFGLTVFGDRLFFGGYTDKSGGFPDKGAELWISDGTTTGTALLKDINPGPADSLISCPRQCRYASFTALNGQLLFSAIDADHGFELWQSDGTPNGTGLLKDIQPGPTESFPNNFLKMGDTLFFVADDGTHGNELWKSDGTPDGTVMVKDIYPGATGAGPTALAQFNNLLYFAAETPAHGFELWRSDGTPDGTVLVHDINPGPTASSPQRFTALGNQLFFITSIPSDTNADDYLWVTDGTSNGTQQFMQLSDTGSLGKYELVNANGRLFFLVLNAQNISELWTSDGTPAGTVQLDGNSESYAFLYFAPLGNRLFFTHADATHGYEPWLSDGSKGGTYMLQDLAANGLNSEPNILALTDQLVYIIADNGSTGQELWAMPLPREKTFLPVVLAE